MKYVSGGPNEVGQLQLCTTYMYTHPLSGNNKLMALKMENKVQEQI